ncbi:MAG: FAD-dependent oxidoreductase [Conexivisphaerales archaeon]
MKDESIVDVAIVGAGIVGLMCAYFFVAEGYRVIIFEKEQEAGQGVTKNQSGVIHVVQLPFNSLKSKLARRGNPMYDDICKRLGVKLKRLSALLVINKIASYPALITGYLYLRLNLRGNFKVSLVGKKTLQKMEPELSDSVKAGIKIDGYGVVDTEGMVGRLSNFLQNKGARIFFGCEFLSGSCGDELIQIRSSCGEFKTRFIVNASGLYSDEVCKRLGLEVAKLTPGLGVMLECSGLQVNNIIAPFSLIQSERTKGGGIIPTTKGTVSIGPTLRLIDDKKAYKVDDRDIISLKKKFFPLLKHEGDVVRVYSGVRPLSPTGDFMVYSFCNGRIISLLGIESPGLTAAPAIAEHVLLLAKQRSDSG